MSKASNSEDIATRYSRGLRAWETEVGLSGLVT